MEGDDLDELAKGCPRVINVRVRRSRGQTFKNTEHFNDSNTKGNEKGGSLVQQRAAEYRHGSLQSR